MKRSMIWAMVPIPAMAAFRAWPGLAGAWAEGVALPLLQGLHRMSAALPFPLLEPLALLLTIALLRRRFRAMALALILGMYGLLWYPGYFAAPAPRYAAPAPRYDAPADAERLCLQLTDALNASALAFEPPFDAAGAVAGLPWARVKPARYPEWMRAMDIEGLFAPWTGEALADPGAPPGSLPFTCVHELMHLKGIADEGQANIAAYRLCVEKGGMYADSARLWALRCALGELDDAARARVTRRASRRLRPLLMVSEVREPSGLFRLLGIGRQTADYDALLGWLALTPPA